MIEDRKHVTIGVLHFDDGRHIKLRAWDFPLYYALVMARNPNSTLQGRISSLLQRGIDFKLGAVLTFFDKREAARWYENGRCHKVCAFCEGEGVKIHAL